MRGALKSHVSKILNEALRGYDMSERYRNSDGFVRWGLVEKDIHAAIDLETTRYVALEAALRELAETLRKERDFLATGERSDRMMASLYDECAAGLLEKIDAAKEGV